MNARPEKYINIFTAIQEGLKSFKLTKHRLNWYNSAKSRKMTFAPIKLCYCSVYRTSWDRWKRQRGYVCNGGMWSPVCLIRIDLGGLQPEYEEKY